MQWYVSWCHPLTRREFVLWACGSYILKVFFYLIQEKITESLGAKWENIFLLVHILSRIVFYPPAFITRVSSAPRPKVCLVLILLACFSSSLRFPLFIILFLSFTPLLRLKWTSSPCSMPLKAFQMCFNMLTHKTCNSCLAWMEKINVPLEEKRNAFSPFDNITQFRLWKLS